MILRNMRSVVLILGCLAGVVARGETLVGEKTLGLTVRDGVLMRDGKAYRAVGVNYFDLFARVLRNEDDTSHRAGLARLSQAGIPFARFMASGFWPVDNDLYLKDKTP